MRKGKTKKNTDMLRMYALVVLKEWGDSTSTNTCKIYGHHHYVNAIKSECKNKIRLRKKQNSLHARKGVHEFSWRRQRQRQRLALQANLSTAGACQYNSSYFYAKYGNENLCKAYGVTHSREAVSREQCRERRITFNPNSKRQSRITCSGAQLQHYAAPLLPCLPLLMYIELAARAAFVALAGHHVVSVSNIRASLALNPKA